MTETTQLTGTQVRELRESYHLSRREFAELCGYPSQTRLYNIEQKDSWKSGDRELVSGVLANLAVNPPKGKRGRLKGETASERIDRLETKLKNGGKLLRDHRDDDDDDDEGPVLYTGIDTEPPDPTDASWNFTPIQLAEEGKQEPRSIASVVVEDHDDWDTFIDQINLSDRKLLSNSEVAVWNRCRRKWWLAFYRQLVYGQIDFSGPRAIGNRVHRALAAWYVPEGVEPVDPRIALKEAIATDWALIKEQVQAHGVQGDIDQVLADRASQFEKACELERAMIEGYMQWLAEEGPDVNLRVTHQETPIAAEINHVVAGEEVKYTAIALLDLRARRASDGVRMFVDHKTTGSLVEPLKTLHMDPQMLHYHLLEFLMSAEGDERCDAALYNMLKKVKRTGTAKPPFYSRVEVHHNAHEIDAYKRRLSGAARDIIRVTKELQDGADPTTVVYPNPTRNCSWDCDFVSVCPMFDDGSRVEDALSALYHVGDPLARYSRREED